MTDVLLLDKLTVAPLPVAALLSRTVPCAVPPTAMFVPLNDTDVTASPIDGLVGDPDLLLLHPAMLAAASTHAANCSSLVT
jgi:hypothetical protein